MQSPYHDSQSPCTVWGETDWHRNTSWDHSYCTVFHNGNMSLEWREVAFLLHLCSLFPFASWENYFNSHLQRQRQGQYSQRNLREAGWLHVLAAPLLYMEFLRFYEVEIMKESTATALNVNIIKSHNSWFETKVTHIVSWPLFLSLLCTTQQTSVLKLHRCVSILQFVPASYYSKCSW